MNNGEKKTIHRILVIDDNPNIHEDFKTILLDVKDRTELDSLRAELFGCGVRKSTPKNKYELDFASQGKEGDEKVKQALSQNRPYELAFVDMRMPPGWDGLETIEHIWKTDPNVQVVICTAYSDYSWEEISRRLGRSENLLILKKPFDSAEVAQLAATLTEKWTLAKWASMKMDELEQMVKERTHELATTNKKLQQEISDRKKAEDALRESEEKFRSLAEQSPNMIFIHSKDKVVYANKKCEEIMGHKREEFYSTDFNFLTLIAPESTDLIKENFNRHSEGEEIQPYEYTLINKAGERIEAINTSKLIQYGGQKAILGIVTDITERKKAEEALRQSEERLKILFEYAPDAIFLNDDQGNFVDGNRSAEEMVGYAKDELIGKNAYETGLLSEEQVPKAAKNLEELAMGKPTGPDEFILKRKDGSYVTVEIRTFLVRIGNQTLGLGIARDITERKKTELNQDELIKKVDNINKELNDFASIVSHDLKAPLRGIKTLANWILADCADKLGEQANKQINLLLDRVERMYNLIEGALQYSRLGQTQGIQTQVNLNDFVPEIINMVVPPENITVTIENELPVIECEETQIMQVFQNLLSNAIKYMDKPQGWIKVGCVEQDGFWKFSVADNGPGIEEKHFEKIFKIFQALPTSPRFEGTGVGLTIAKKIVELYNGKIWVESKVGEGSTFFFTLPKQKIGAKK
ncbi:MAG: PAS domain S-box protein [Sedimentisphaerales bacterium]|jgi:PAS domain S-box-containing protein